MVEGNIIANKRQELTKFSWKAREGEIVEEVDGTIIATFDENGRLVEYYDTEVKHKAAPTKSEVPPEETSKKTIKKKKVNKPPSEYIKEFKDEWAQRLLEVLYVNEFDVRFAQLCKQCGSTDETDGVALYRCTECFHATPMCKECIVSIHCANPFHRIEKWTGTHLEKVFLSDLGLVICLGHSGEPCTKRSDAVLTTIVHTNGIQDSLISYCDCDHLDEEKKSRPLQLLKYGLYSATFKRTQTAFTTAVLKQFHNLAMQGKLTAHDFCASLRRLTNYAFKDDSSDRYREFMMAHRQYSFLRELRWAHRRADEVLPEGSLAVECPACPQPNVNMDPNWRNCRKDLMYIHMPSYSKDGNFQQCLHNKKLDMNDVPLTKGASYYAHDDEYAKHLKRVKGTDGDRQTSSCSNFKALSNQYKGKIVSGIVSLTCSRHGFVLPSGTVDLPKGETFASVDFATVKGIAKWKNFPFIVSSYDINCQYGKNFLARVSTLTDVASLPLFIRCVPKYHLVGHKQECRFTCSFWYMPGTGMTDGEAPERRWAVDNNTSRSLREMTPGHREDEHNKHAGDLNMQKTCAIACSLKKKYAEGVISCAEIISDLEEFEETIMKRGFPLADWREEEKKWKEVVTSKVASDNPRILKKLKNPYEPEEEIAPSEKQIIAALNEQLQNLTEQSNIPRRGIRLGEFLKQGLEIQEKQRALISQQNDNEESEERATLVVRIKRWTEQHATLIGPIIEQMKEDATIDEALWPDAIDIEMSSVEDIVLPMPSAYRRIIRKHALFSTLVAAECTLREAQANDILKHLRTKLTCQSLLKIETKKSVGQPAKTRDSQILDRSKMAIKALQNDFNAIFKTLCALDSNYKKGRYQKIEDKDIKPFNLYHLKLKEKKKRLPWIWRSSLEILHSNTRIDKWNEEMSKVEWFRFSAKATRWREEIKLLEEEIKRIQRFFSHKCLEWNGISQRCGSGQLDRGIAAYAARHSAMYKRLLLEAQKNLPNTLLVSCVD